MTGFLPKDLKSSTSDLKHGFQGGGGGGGAAHTYPKFIGVPPGGVAAMKRPGVIFLLHMQLRNLSKSRILELEKYETAN